MRLGLALYISNLMSLYHSAISDASWGYDTTSVSAFSVLTPSQHSTLGWLARASLDMEVTTEHLNISQKTQTKCGSNPISLN